MTEALSAPPATLDHPGHDAPGRPHLPLPPTQPSAAGRWRGWAAGGLVVAAAIGLVAWLRGHTDQPPDAVAVAARMDLPITVTERGELESSRTTEVRCEVEGYENKLVSILPEGTPVTKGQVVATFDSDTLARSLHEEEIRYRAAQTAAEIARADLEIQRQKAQGDIARAELDRVIAHLDLEQYLPTKKELLGEFQVEIAEKKGEVEMASKNLEDAQERLAKYRRFVRKGFGTPEQLRFKELEVAQLQYARKSKGAQLSLTETVQHAKKKAELMFRAQDAQREVERARKSTEAATKAAERASEAAADTARIEKLSLDRLRHQLACCTVAAPASGIVIYSKDYAWDPIRRVQPGAMIHFQQVLFTLPDLDHMHIRVKVHESVIKKLRAGQQASISVDADPSMTLHGTVEQLAALADSKGPGSMGGVKEYPALVRIDDLPRDAGLRPGMTALVTIAADRLPSVLSVPLEAVAEDARSHYVFTVDQSGKVSRREVEVGPSNEAFVAVKDGLSEGEHVTLDASTRLNEAVSSKP